MRHKQITMGEITPEYQAFTDKFKPKLTTDDCYTPDNIYEVVRSWVFEHYGLPADTPVVRPFWPGGDYQAEEYPDGCVVIDNPPFSIISDIQRFYLAAGSRFSSLRRGRRFLSGISAYTTSSSERASPLPMGPASTSTLPPV